MSEFRFLLIAVLAGVVFAGQAAADDPNAEKPRPPVLDTPPPGPSGGVVIPDEGWDLIADEPAGHFKQGLDLADNGDARGARRELRKGTFFLRLEAGRARKEDRAEILAAVGVIDSLGNLLMSPAPPSPATVRIAVARGLQAVAHHHRHQLEDNWVGRNVPDSGRELKATANYLALAWSWAGLRIGDEVANELADAVTLGDQMIDGIGWNADRVDHAVKAMAEQSTLLDGDLSRAK